MFQPPQFSNYRQSSFQQNKYQPTSRFSNLFNEENLQSGQQQIGQKNNVQQKIYDGLKGYSYENKEDNFIQNYKKLHLPSSYRQYNIVKNDNSKQFNSIMPNQIQHRSYQNKQHSIELEDDIIEIQDHSPYIQEYNYANKYVQGQNAYEDIDDEDDESVNLIGDNSYHSNSQQYYKKNYSQPQNLNSQTYRSNYFASDNDPYYLNRIQSNQQQTIYGQKKFNENIPIERLHKQNYGNQGYYDNQMNANRIQTQHEMSEKEKREKEVNNIFNKYNIKKEQLETQSTIKQDVIPPKKILNIVKVPSITKKISSPVKKQPSPQKKENIQQKKDIIIVKKQKEIEQSDEDDDYFDIKKQNKEKTHKPYEPEYQGQQRNNTNYNQIKNNSFLNPPQERENPYPKTSKDILDQIDLKQKKPTEVFEIEDDLSFESDYSSSEQQQKKKQKLNDGRGSKQMAYVKQYYDKVNSHATKQRRLVKKEEEKKQKIKQELIEQARLERERKLEEDSKLQRQKLASYKKLGLQKQKLRQQKSNPINEFKEQLKYFNFDENFAKSTNLQAKRLLLLDDNKKTENVATDGQVVNEESAKNMTDIMGYDRDFDYIYDEIESEEERKNYFSLIRFIFSQDYNKVDISRVENKRIPKKFSSWKEYFTIFEYLFLMECISNMQQIFLSYKQNENYRAPFKSFIKLLNNKDNIHGFFEFQVYKNGYETFEVIPQTELEAGEVQQTEDDYYQLSTLKNNVVLITNESQPDLQLLSSTNFRKKSSFLFFGWIVPPENDKTGVLKIFVDIDADSFRRQFQQNDKKIPVNIFNFQKMTTQLREYLSIKNMRYNDLNRFIYNPQHIVETKVPISNPQCLLPLFEELKQKYNVSQFQSIKEICLTSQGICMLQGPPGTGKTHTLLGLLSGLYFYIKKNPETTKPKIMICAPSNTAVDEIVSRIIEIGLHAPGEQKISVNVIRIGAIDYVPSENVKQACLEYQIEKKMKEIGMSQNKMVECETIVDMQIEVAKINNEVSLCKKELNGEELRNQLDFLLEKKRRLQQKISMQKLEKVARRDQIKNISDQIIGLADVVCCTLTSSISDKLERFKNQVEVLIVDEAAQCTEPNNIIPLFYQPNKMVLIGDPKQLPATTFQPDSNITKYNRSLFERIIENNIKPYFLDQQYRMHQLIREFPSMMFYDNKLKDGALILNRPFPNYLQQFENKNVQFIDLTFSKEKVINKSYYNKAEGLASIHICTSIIEVIENLKLTQPEKHENPSIGIITPYKQQTKFIWENVRQMIPKAYHKCIQVNTIDSFQGQEKDIIIFTTVRVNIRDEWRENMIGFLQDERRMNVAITRARFCLIILGHADTLNSNPMWGTLIDFMVFNI